MSAYDEQVLSDSPVAFYLLSETDAGYHGGSTGTMMPNGDGAAVFNGTSGYFEVADHDAISVTTSGVLTIEAWLRPDTLEQPATDGGYVHWLGKGVPGQHEYALRMYPKSSPDRPNRISGYAFSPTAVLGAGSYFQDMLTVGQWIHVAVTIDTKLGTVCIYRDGVLRDTDPLSGYWVVPGNGNAPLRIGTRDFKSFFLGGIGKVAFYDYAISSERLLAHHSAMVVP